MKKFLSIILCISLIASFGITSFAEYVKAEDVTSYPVIMVPGYGSASLRLDNGDGTYEEVWGLNINSVLNTVVEKIPELAVGVGALSAGETEHIVKTIGEELINICGKLACNDDGSSTYDVDTFMTEPAESNWKYLKEKYPDGSYRPEPEVGEVIADIIGDENMFTFNCDFRMSAVNCATRLDTYIEKVLDYTGAEKVNIIAISHGGQITGTYLSLFGSKNQVDNAVLIVPALGGAGLAYDCMSGNAILDEETLVNFIENGLGLEQDANWLVRANELGFLDELIEGLIPYIKQIVGNWGSIWDFIPYEYYKETVTQCLDPVENAKLIETTTYFHENIMNNYDNVFKECREAGMNISIIAGSGNNIVTGLNLNSDGIITVNDSTGAKCAEFGKRFSDGYKCTGSNCTDPSHNHLSPSMEIDASYCYMPENTWFIDGLFHGMEIRDSYTTALYTKLLLTDELTDIYSNEDYPQFKASTNPCYEVTAYFSDSKEGYLSAADKQLIVKNISNEYTIRIASVNIEGIDIELSRKTTNYIKPGEETVYDINGDIPQISGVRCAVIVTFIAEGSLTPLAERTLDFTVLNGEYVNYDESNPYSDVDYTPGVKQYLDDDTISILDKFGILDFVNMIYNIFAKLFKALNNFFG